MPSRRISQPQLLQHQFQFEQHTQDLQQPHILLQQGIQPLARRQQQQQQVFAEQQRMCETVIPLQPTQPFTAVYAASDSRSSQYLLPAAPGVSMLAPSTFHAEVAPLQSSTAQACAALQPVDPSLFMTRLQQLPKQGGAQMLVRSPGPFCSHENRCGYSMQCVQFCSSRHPYILSRLEKSLCRNGPSILQFHCRQSWCRPQ
jgi:hypothetical protein